MIRIGLLIVGGLIGALAVGLAPEGLRQNFSPEKASATVEHRHDEAEGAVKLSGEQIEAAGITLAQAQQGVLSRKLFAPGTIVPSGDRIARVAVRLVGTVSELRKHLGDVVEAGEVVAVIESREVADAKTEYLATKLTNDLQQTLFARAKMLFENKISSENDFLRARTTALDSEVKFEVAQQKLAALGLTDKQIADLPKQPANSLKFQELRSPISGRIAERRVDVGALVGREGQESELFVIVDLSEVWIEMAIPLSELPNLREGQDVTIASGAMADSTNAKVVFISPLLDKDTRAARVVAKVSNPEQAWRPGAFVTAEIPLSQFTVPIAVPKTALQSVNGDPVVFVRTEQGFEKRPVKTARSDGQRVEITSGLNTGDEVAVANSFVLKAELGKSEAGHGD